MAHGLATLLNRRATALSNAADKHKRQIAGLIEAQDGSEVAEMELENTTGAFETLWEKADAMKIMAEEAAKCYEIETGQGYTPVTGSRNTKDARATGAVFEAKELLNKHDRELAERNKVAGPKIAITGDINTSDCREIYRILDQTLIKHPNMVLCHKGHQKGVERIAATWARNNKVNQILFRPNWQGHGKAAPFKANDAIIAAKPIGVLIFGGNGVAMSLGQKAEARRIKVGHFATE